MRLVRPGEFERALRALDRDSLAAFVAELWAAGGWDTSVEGSLVVAERAGRRRRIRVVPAGRGLERIRRWMPALGDPELGDLDLGDPPPGDFGVDDSRLDDPDVVVDASGSERVAAAARAADAEYVPPDALRDRLLYGAPREVAADLSERYLDRPLERVRSPGTDDPFSADDLLATRRTLRVGSVLVVLAVLAVGALAAGPLGLLSGGPGQSPGDADAVQSGPVGPTPTAATAGAASAGTMAGTVAPETSTESPFPPGLSARGVENVSVLAEAHVVATKNRQYAIDVSFEGPAAATGFEDFESVQWSLRVESRHNYRLDATYRRSNDTDPRWQRLGIYSDGISLFRRTVTPNETRYAAAPAKARDSRAYLYVAASMIERYLDTTASTARPTETPEGLRYHVVATGTPARLNDSVVDYRAEALVTPAGRVTMLEARYTIEVDGVEQQVRVRFDYSDYETARVDPPEWYDEAKNRTAG